MLSFFVSLHLSVLNHFVICSKSSSFFKGNLLYFHQNWIKYLTKKLFSNINLLLKHLEENIKVILQKERTNRGKF